MPRTTGPARRAGRPAATSREEVVAAARRIVEQEGADALTIRRLAADLGVGPTTLYRHVRDREDLLVLLVSDFVEQVPPPHLPDDPRERIVVAITSIHDALAGWPWAAEVLTSDGFIGRIGERGLVLVEAIVSGAVEAGCSADRAVEVFRDLWYFTVGEILVRSRTERFGPIRAELSFDPEALPHLAALGKRWGEVAAEDTFGAGAEAFVEGLLARFAQ